MNQGRGSFLVKLQTPSKSRSTKVYHLLNFRLWFVLMNYDGPFCGIPFFFCYFLCAIVPLALRNPYNGIKAYIVSSIRIFVKSFLFLVPIFSKGSKMRFWFEKC